MTHEQAKRAERAAKLLPWLIAMGYTHLHFNEPDYILEVYGLSDQAKPLKALIIPIGPSSANKWRVTFIDPYTYRDVEFPIEEMTRLKISKHWDPFSRTFSECSREDLAAILFALIS